MIECMDSKILHMVLMMLPGLQSIQRASLKIGFQMPSLELKVNHVILEQAKELARNQYQFQWWALSLIHARPVDSTVANPREGKKEQDMQATK